MASLRADKKTQRELAEWWGVEGGPKWPLPSPSQLLVTADWSSLHEDRRSLRSARGVNPAL